MDYDRIHHILLLLFLLIDPSFLYFIPLSIHREGEISISSTLTNKILYPLSINQPSFL